MLRAAGPNAVLVIMAGDRLPLIEGRASAEALAQALPRVVDLRSNHPHGGFCPVAAPVLIRALACRLKNLVALACGRWDADAYAALGDCGQLTDVLLCMGPHGALCKVGIWGLGPYKALWGAGGLSHASDALCSCALA